MNGLGLGECRSCGAPLRWVVAEATGARMPLDVEPTGDGNVELLADGRARVHRDSTLTFGETGERFLSHFATCPQANEWRS